VIAALVLVGACLWGMAGTRVSLLLLVYLALSLAAICEICIVWLLRPLLRKRQEWTERRLSGRSERARLALRELPGEELRMEHQTAGEVLANDDTSAWAEALASRGAREDFATQLIEEDLSRATELVQYPARRQGVILTTVALSMLPVVLILAATRIPPPLETAVFVLSLGATSWHAFRLNRRRDQETSARSAMRGESWLGLLGRPLRGIHAFARAFPALVAAGALASSLTAFYAQRAGAGQFVAVSSATLACAFWLVLVLPSLRSTAGRPSRISPRPAARGAPGPPRPLAIELSEGPRGECDLAKIGSKGEAQPETDRAARE
jgi:hypothetical protein